MEISHLRPTRRNMLWEMAGGLGGIALANLLTQERLLGQIATSTKTAVTESNQTKVVKARNVIQIFCPGGISHVDTWDYKPELARRQGKPFDADGKLTFFASKPGNCQGSFWKFRQHGECGRWISDLFPRLAMCVDDIAFVHSMQSKSALHGPAMFMMNSGFTRPGFPCMGSWISYGLGSLNDELPAFVVLPDSKGLPPGGVSNWGAGFLPAEFQGTTLDVASDRMPITDLVASPEYTQGELSEKSTRDFIQQLNRQHSEIRSADADLEARIKSYELAAKLQLSAPEATDINGESPATLALYGLEEQTDSSFGRQCLLARRLVERGVRFVQIYCGAENTTAKKIRPNWDSHEDLPRDHGYWGKVLDVGAAALLKDLKQRGLLESTLVICTTEFGRQPAAQGGLGRDHNAGAFTAWMAGGGVLGGSAYGSTDELGYQALIHPTYCYDIHATALHLLGIDHTKLTYYNNGIQRRLTDVHGEILQEVLC